LARNIPLICLKKREKEVFGPTPAGGRNGGGTQVFVYKIPPLVVLFIPLIHTNKIVTIRPLIIAKIGVKND
jgi:hypothetical protein